VEFFFPGGRPGEFLDAVEKQYKVDWKKVADIPDNMREVQIPTLRMNRQSAESISRRGGGGGFGGFAVGLTNWPGEGGLGGGFFGGGGGGGIPADRNPLDALIVLYNSLQQAKPELGHLLVEGDLAKPSVVIFYSGVRTTLPDRKVKAFALKGISENEWGKLENEINAEFERELMRKFELFRHTPLQMPVDGGHASLHKDLGLLLVDGPEWSVEAAESFVAAWLANHPRSQRF
jgi:hypothetical protein